MNVKADSCFPQNPVTVVKLRCPVCLQRGLFESVGGGDVLLNNGVEIVGQRRCPDPTCHALVFFVFKSNRLVASYPAERIDFDATNIPATVIAAFEEAITCHASKCFVASAMMVRKTLEELCETEKRKESISKSASRR